MQAAQPPAAVSRACGTVESGGEERATYIMGAECEKGRPFSLPFPISATRFVASRYFPLMGMTSGHGASTDLQGFYALPHI